MDKPDRILRLREVSQITGLGRSQIYALAKREEFPSPLKLSVRCSGWLQSEISAWINWRVAMSGRDSSGGKGEL